MTTKLPETDPALETEVKYDKRNHIPLIIMGDGKGGVKLQIVRDPLTPEEQQQPTTIAEITATALLRLWQTGTIPSLIGTVCHDLIKENQALQMVAERQQRIIEEEAYKAD